MGGLLGVLSRSKLFVYGNQSRVDWGTEGCGLGPQPLHTKSRKQMVPVAPLLTLGIKRWVLGNLAGQPGVSL